MSVCVCVCVCVRGRWLVGKCVGEGGGVSAANEIISVQSILYLQPATPNYPPGGPFSPLAEAWLSVLPTSSQTAEHGDIARTGFCVCNCQ